MWGAIRDEVIKNAFKESFFSQGEPTYKPKDLIQFYLLLESLGLGDLGTLDIKGMKAIFAPRVVWQLAIASRFLLHPLYEPGIKQTFSTQDVMNFLFERMLQPKPGVK